MNASLPVLAWLSRPADRPDRYAKALAAADMVIIDLEDAVSPATKASAREALANAQLDPARVVVRINAVSSSEHAADVAALRRTPFRTVMLAKTESPDQLEHLSGWDVVVLLETPRGIAHAQPIGEAPAAGAATSIDGRMIASPLIRQAERVLAAPDHGAGLPSAEPRGRHADRKQTEQPPARSTR